MKTIKGVSFLELLIAVAVIGILATAGIMGSRNYLEQLRLSQAKQDTLSAIKQISSQAIQQSRQLELSLDAAGKKIIWKENTTEVGQITLSNNASIAIQTKQLPSQPIRFSSRGIPNQQVTFTVARGNRTSSLVLLVTGLVIEL